MEKLESVHFPKVLRMRLACALLKLNQFRVSPAVKFLFLGSCFCFSLSLSLSHSTFSLLFSEAMGHPTLPLFSCNLCPNMRPPSAR